MMIYNKIQQFSLQQGIQKLKYLNTTHTKKKIKKKQTKTRNYFLTEMVSVVQIATFKPYMLHDTKNDNKNHLFR